MRESKSVFGFQNIYGNGVRNVNGDRIGYVKEFKSVADVLEWVSKDPDYREQLVRGATNYFRGQNIVDCWREIMRKYRGQMSYMDKWEREEYLTKMCMSLHREKSADPNHDKDIIERNSPKEVDKQNIL